MARLKDIHIEKVYDKTYDVWSDISTRKIANIDGIIIHIEYDDRTRIRVDPRYCEESAIKELEALA